MFQADGASAANDEEPLPAGWAMSKAPNGRVFYIDHNTRVTTWVSTACSLSISHLWSDLKDGVLILFWTYWYNFRLVCLGGPKEDSKPACQCQTDGGHPHSGQEELLQWEPPSESRTFTSACIFYLSSYRKHVLHVCSADSYKN